MRDKETKNGTATNPTIAVQVSATPDREDVLAELQRLYEAKFQNADRQARILDFIVQTSLSGNTSELSEQNLAVKFYGRDATFNADDDPIVRLEVAQMGRRLARYYNAVSNSPKVVIEIAAGSFTARFAWPGSEHSAEGVQKASMDD